MYQIKKAFKLSYDERNSEHLEVRGNYELLLRDEALKVTASFLDTLHGTRASDVGFAVTPSAIRTLFKESS